MVHTRFLALLYVPWDVFSIILQRMQCLETLILREIEESVFLDVQDMINMARLRFLRHFQVSNFAFQKINEEMFKKQKPSICFENLQHLSRPYLYYDCHIDKLMRLMPNLRKLNLHIFFFSYLPERYPRLDLLKNLESLAKSLEVSVEKIKENQV